MGYRMARIWNSTTLVMLLTYQGSNSARATGIWLAKASFTRFLNAGKSGRVAAAPEPPRFYFSSPE